MSLTIRLSRIGRKNQPAYKLVVANTRSKRNGQAVDIIGHYNPYEPTDKFSYDKEKFEKWVKQGAFVTTAVSKLIENKYEYVKYDPKKIKEEKEAAAKEKEAENNVENEKEVSCVFQSHFEISIISSTKLSISDSCMMLTGIPEILPT